MSVPLRLELASGPQACTTRVHPLCALMRARVPFRSPFVIVPFRKKKVTPRNGKPIHSETEDSLSSL